ncbi:Glycine-rich RNA-binding protein RZ1B [Hypsizygus marmoreus]|uniref:Glycine-rich RNA-binding protein RZ1B n=1 Tax=Hypsizygus marmoreus TaxID=39966 RepID=A0A369KA27_HYPMA|nr:Glycine-rich RNA-binding protein RZ1B [Hypsizygus marmoreus]
MAPPPTETDPNAMQQDNWGPQDDQAMGPGGTAETPNNGAPLPADEERAAVQGADNPEYPRGSSVSAISVSDSKGDSFREKQVKPNKVYVGGLPEHTTQEDLQSCFGKIGNIVNIELKVGYGFVEFDNREAAEESVAKYHEGYFMGNKIRVELSRGGGRTAKYTGDPGACFKCGQMGHWARECPNHTGIVPRRPFDPPLIDRIQRDNYAPAQPPRNLPPRDDMGGPGRLPPPRDVRYDYPPRDFRRDPSPRDFREYPAPPPPPPGRGREYDDYRRGPPMTERDRYMPPPPSDYRGRYPPPPDPAYRGYGSAPTPPPPPPAFYDRYDRRPVERYPPPYPSPHGGRPRTPPRDFDRIPPRDYDYRGRPPTPPPPARYDDYRPGPVEPVPAGRYKRRSESPPRTYDHAYPTGGSYGNSYPGGTPGGPPPAGPPPQRGGPPPRDYMPPRNGRDVVETNPGYRRH